MKEIILLLTTNLIIITGYIIGISGKFLARKSISDSDYWLTKPWKWLFEAVIIYSSFGLIMTSLYLKAPIMLIGSIMLGMIAPFARFKLNKFMNIGHMFFAFGGFILLSISFWIDLNIWYLTIGITVVSLSTLALTWRNECKIWNLEIALIYSLFFSLIYTVLNYIS